MNNFVFEAVKGYAARAVSSVAEYVYGCETHYIPKGPVAQVEAVVRARFEALEPDQKNRIYGKVWELAKMHNTRADGDKWGEEHVFDDISRLGKAMHRLGYFSQETVHPVACLPHSFGEGGIGSRYFSLETKLGKEPSTGQIGLINGMGLENYHQAIIDADWFSKVFADNCNIHGVYHSTHRNSRRCCGTPFGVFQDVLRMKAVNGGSYTKTSYLAAQQIIDYLDSNPDKKYLQVGISEGAAHVNATIRLIKEARPELLPRICVILLVPAYFIMPEQFDNQVQLMSFVKNEDGVINPWGINTDKIGYSPHITVVPHEHKDHPHCWGGGEFQKAVKPYVDTFLATGSFFTR